MGHDIQPCAPFDAYWSYAEFDLDKDIVTRQGRYPDTVEARSVLCYWATRKHGFSTLELSKRLGISQPTASQSAKRCEKIVKEKQLKVMG